MCRGCVVMSGVFDPRVSAAETHAVSGELDGEDEGREGSGVGSTRVGPAGDG